MLICYKCISFGIAAESFGLPLIPPYLAGEDARGRDFRQGVNFAVAGATALDSSFFRERGVRNPLTNVSLGTQLKWFKDVMPSFCSNSSGKCFLLYLLGS